jgi:hypothetical protein
MEIKCNTLGDYGMSFSGNVAKGNYSNVRDRLYQYYVGHFVLCEAYLIQVYTTFRELVLLPSSGGLLSFYRHRCY